MIRASFLFISASSYWLRIVYNVATLHKNVKYYASKWKKMSDFMSLGRLQLANRLVSCLSKEMSREWFVDGWLWKGCPPLKSLGCWLVPKGHMERLWFKISSRED